MSESDSGAKTPKRLAPPFPSRKQVHGARIPQGDDSAANQPDPELAEPTSPLPKRREAPRRPRTIGIGDTQTGPESASPHVKDPETGDSGDVFVISEGVAFQPVKSGAAEPADGPAAEPEQGAEPAVEPSQDQSGSSSLASPFPKRISPVTGSQPVLESTVDVRERVTKAGENRRTRRRKNRRIWTVVLVIAILALVGVGGYFAFQGIAGGPALKPADDYPAVDWENDEAAHPLVEVTVEPGQIGSEIGATLLEADVVKSVKAFTRAFDSNPASSSIKPGTYELPTKIPAAEALAALLDETNRSENTITVNSGQTVEQIAEKMVSVAGFENGAVQAVIDDPADVESLPEEANGNLEGWLWPGSYDFSPTSDPSELFSTMVKPTVDFLESNEVPEDEWEDVLIQASIVEREVNREEDMPKVARVIVNRIEDPDGPTRGMLQMDSTVTYGVGGTGGLPDSAAFEDDNPYNTYRIKGLPAGPIASPSKEAIKAVLEPADGDWFYFVTVNLHTGETIFTDSHEELQELTEQLVAWCEDNPGECRK